MSVSIRAYGGMVASCVSRAACVSSVLLNSPSVFTITFSGSSACTVSLSSEVVDVSCISFVAGVYSICNLSS